MDKKPRDISRRVFLKNCALLAFSVGLTSCTPSDHSLKEMTNGGNESGSTGDSNNENNSNTESGENKVNPFDFDRKLVLLNSGHEMPIIGIGTYMLSISQAEESVYNALRIGMRLIDTADIYGNERGVARGIKRAMQDFGIPREEIFVTSKLWTSTFAQADREIDERLERLELDYVDLLLLHHTADNDEYAYQAMEKGIQTGKLRSLGISNFYENDVDRIMQIATIPPAIVQNETHPYHQMRSIKNHIAPLGSILESWFPLGGRGTGIRTLSTHDVITGIATEIGKTPYQVIIRWQLQCGNIVIPGSSNPNHIAEDFTVFDFNLTDEQMARINALDCNHRFANY